jgi:hypothetical protein
MRNVIRSSLPSQRAGLVFLIEKMPLRDLRTLSADFLLEHLRRLPRRWIRAVGRRENTVIGILTCQKFFRVLPSSNDDPGLAGGALSLDFQNDVATFMDDANRKSRNQLPIFFRFLRIGRPNRLFIGKQFNENG